MGREIRFRAWDKKWGVMFDNDIMLNGGRELVKFAKRNSPIPEVQNAHGGLLLPTDDENMIFMQYTGLKDKNGKEIYEGDITQGENSLQVVKWVESSAKFGVKVIKSDFVLLRGCTFPIQQYVKDGTLQCVFEVIGNIYENPELLEG